MLFRISAKTEHLSKPDSAFPVFKVNTDQQLLKQHCPEILGIPKEEVNTEMLSLEDDEILEGFQSDEADSPIATLPPLSGEAAEGSVKRSLIDEFSSTQGCRKVKQHRVKLHSAVFTVILFSYYSNLWCAQYISAMLHISQAKPWPDLKMFQQQRTKGEIVLERKHLEDPAVIKDTMLKLELLVRPVAGDDGSSDRSPVMMVGMTDHSISDGGCNGQDSPSAVTTL
nr:uncharacterized protein LOC109147049 [Ipomoea trifida]